MNKFKGLLIASDFDGTLADLNGTVNENQIERIRYFISRGGLFTVCTGRTMPGFKAFDSRYINAPVIVSNGAMLYDYNSKKTVYEDCIQFADAELLNEIHRAFPDMSIELYSNTFKVFAVKPDERTLMHFAGQGLKHTEINMPDEAEFPLVKVMLGIGREHCKKLQNMLDCMDLCNLKYIPTYGDYVELNSKTTDKGAGLLTLAKLLNIDKNHVFAVGDGSNDVDMLKAAKIGFVPENGDSFAKAAADVTVCSNDDGAVAAVIDYIENNLTG